MEKAKEFAEKAQNNEQIEQEFAVKAVQQMEVYWKILESVKGSSLQLTPHDDEIYQTLLEMFPEYKNVENLKVLNEDEMKSKEGKERWRAFFKKFDQKIEDYNFGTLVRMDSSKEYTQENTLFVVRLQFYAFEIARNKLGLNDWICKK